MNDNIFCSKKNRKIGQSRIGQVSTSRFGTVATIIEYENADRIFVQSEYDNKTYVQPTSYSNFIKHLFITPFDKRIYKVGYYGVGNYNSDDIAYPMWYNMISRCYKSKKYESTMSYENCVVCEEWHNYQNFAKWFHEHFYECEEGLMLDKDILIHDNKTYSPYNCLLVPKRINLLFIKEKKRRGNSVIGTSIDKRNGKYRVNVSGIGYVGYSNSEMQAFQIYKDRKEKYIKQIADEYRDILPEYIYKALYDYEVLITD